MRLIGCGSYLPKNIVSNFDLEKRLDTSNEWIVTRTGITQRHIASPEETATNLGIKASLEAIKSANIAPEDLEFILVASTTNEEIFPSIASKIQAALGAKKAFAFDIQAVCSGFLYALSLADLMTSRYKCGLVIGTEVMSRLLNWDDRSTCVLFGDGAGAVVVNNESHNILSSVLGTNGEMHDALYASPHISMNGQQVFRYGIEKMQSSMAEVLQQCHKTTEDIAYFIPHQANARMIEMIRTHFDVPKEKMVMTVDRHANTSAASIPLALSSVWDQIKEGDLFVLTAAGAGFTWGSMVVKK
jgi:3-oxoacyl-[acyl-carrier-protein] synthase-3